MGRLTPEDRQEIQQLASAPNPLGAALGAGGRYFERGRRLAELGLGTAAGIATPSLLHKAPVVGDWLPDVSPSTLAESGQAFWEQARQGDVDAAIGAFTDPMEAGTGYWGAAGLGAELLAPFGLAKVGTKLASRASPIAQTLGRGLQLPWKAEEAIGRGITYPFRKGWQAVRGRPAVEAVQEAGERVDVVDDIPTPEQAMEIDELAGPAIRPDPTTAPRVTGEVVEEAFGGPPERYSKEWPFGTKTGEEPLQMGTTGQRLGGMREEATYLRTTQEGLRSEISQVKKMIQDEKRLKRVAAQRGEKRSRLAEYDAAIKGHEKELKFLEKSLDELPEAPPRPVEPVDPAVKWQADLDRRLTPPPEGARQRTASELLDLGGYSPLPSSRAPDKMMKAEQVLAKSMRRFASALESGDDSHRLYDADLEDIEIAFTHPFDPTLNIALPSMRVGGGEFLGDHAKAIRVLREGAEAIDKKAPIRYENALRADTDRQATAIQKAIDQHGSTEPITSQGFREALSEALERSGMTEADYWDLQRRTGADILDVNRTAQQRAASKMKDIRQAAERDIFERSFGGKPLADINLDPAAAFAANPRIGTWSRGANAIAEISNRFLGGIGVSKRVRKRTEGLEGVVETAKRVRDTTMARAESAANLATTTVRVGLRDHFTTDAAGNILDEALQNRVRVAYEGGEAILQSPTIQDIAARYDVYEPLLTSGQREFMGTLRELAETGSTQEIGGSQVYIPGWNKVFRDNIPGWDPNRVRPDVTGNGFYLSRGRIRTTDGETLYSITEELDDLIKLAEDPTKKGLLAAEKQAKMPAMGRLVDDQGNAIKTPDGELLQSGRYDLPDKTLGEYIKGVAGRITDANIDTRLKELAKAHRGRKRKLPERAKGLEIVDADDAFAATLNREFRESPVLKFAKLPVIRHINNLYRGIKANFDLSAIGIHGGLALFRTPKQWGQATGLTFRSLYNSARGRRGQEVIDEALQRFDKEATDNGRLVSRIWANLGLRQGGTAVETGLPGVERMMEVRTPVVGAVARGLGGGFQLSNRLFGAFGDALRLRWADELLRHELAKGRTMEQLHSSGELRQIANAANRMTGWSDKQFAGDIGEFSMFAARFFQSRLEVLGQSLLGAGRLATRRKQTIESREALHTMTRLIGLGAFATELANAALGHETDRRPFVNGRVNSNFYTIRAGGRDFSVFGPTVGLFRAIATLAADPSANGLNQASRGLTSGVVRLFWDNYTGYTFTGAPAPLGVIRADPQVGKVADPMDILRYIGDLALPIAPGAAGGELIEGVQSAMEGDWERAAGAMAAAAAEVPGFRVARLSRSDEREELAQEIYSEPYDDLDGLFQEEIDDMVTERMGERGKKGPKGYLYEKKEAADTALLEGLQRIAEQHLSAPTTSDDWSATISRIKYNEARQVRVGELYGHTWDVEKQRTTGGINDKLYDRDKPREEPEPGTREHRVWRYYKIFEDATGEDGKINWDESDDKESNVDTLSAAFWSSLTRPEAEELLRNIRLIEREYPEEMKKLINAGRYASSYTQVIRGHESNYWKLDRHPAFIKFIAAEADVTESTVIGYLDLSTAEREAQRHVPGKAREMQEAVGKAYKDSGVMGDLQLRFVDSAWRDNPLWIIGMRDAGYKYRDSENRNNLIRKRVRDPEGIQDPNISASQYERLYLDELVPN